MTLFWTTFGPKVFDSVGDRGPEVSLGMHSFLDQDQSKMGSAHRSNLGISSRTTFGRSDQKGADKRALLERTCSGGVKKGVFWAYPQT